MANFTDAAAYERYMGGWSRAAALPFLRWLALPNGLRWLDVGCGSGAFSAALLRSAAPAVLHGIDRSRELLALARGQLPSAVQLHEGDAAELPFADAVFDVAVMPLVVVFLADAPRAVAEMMRVVTTGGTAATYIWDLPHGFPYAQAFSLLQDIGVLPERATADGITALPSLQALWQEAGFVKVQTAAFDVKQRYPSFTAYWQALQDSASIGGELAALTPAGREDIRIALHERLPLSADGSITVQARAHAVKGIVARGHKGI